MLVPRLVGGEGVASISTSTGSGLTSLNSASPQHRHPEKQGHFASSPLSILRPDPLQGLPELIGAGNRAQRAPAEDRGDPPELEPSGKGKDCPGHQGQ